MADPPLYAALLLIQLNFAIGAVGLLLNIFTGSLVGSAFLDYDESVPQLEYPVNARCEGDSWGHALLLYSQCILAYSASIAHYTGAWMVFDSLGGYRCGWENFSPNESFSCTGRNWTYLLLGFVGLLATGSASANAGILTTTLLKGNAATNLESVA